MDPPSYPDPALIGKAFVRQYYTQMHKDPSQMHRFYLEQSSFVHGGSEIGSEEPVIGQKAIHEKVSSLDLRQVHAKIKQVDSHHTLGKGIVVQVTGELSIGGHPMRAFVQTFVLAPETPKKYYVHNDIFRYQDDDLVSESETNETPGEGETTPLLEQVVPEDSEFQSEKSVEGGTGEGIRGVYESQNAELGDSTVNHPVTDGQQPSDVGTGGWSSYGDSAHMGEVTQNGLDNTTPQPPQEFPSATEPVEDRQAEETFSSGETPEQDNKASTWASMLAQKQQSGNRPLNSSALPTTQSLPQREPRPRRTDNSRPSQTQPLTSGGLKDKKPPLNTRDSPDNCQVFVGGLPPNTHEDELREVFKEYGTVVDVRVNPKNFAFVVFSGAKAASDVMHLKDPPMIRGKSLNIEAKRAPRSGGGGRGGGGDRNRGGAPGGPGGKPRGGKPPKR